MQLVCIKFFKLNLSINKKIEKKIIFFKLKNLDYRFINNNNNNKAISEQTKLLMHYKQIEKDY